MRITFDPAKDARNVAERGLSFERVADIEWDTALSQEDTRRDYGEKRVRVLGFIDRRLYAVVITMRGDALHVISFRKANAREVRRYEHDRR
ncbi:BrnT family toxin [Methylobacterium sp. Leaf108]|uniref:BrnT family toxin n=1 Tax=Methylobacterium sp. Leaf108 TaxID=1736256 RepID=UPI0006F94833|nr:BrnT family toxin [Methylobacterium sp. Leaf108]KQP51418.1 hypothetical protein ASF39_10340 [Methylobacterium sp. Leaf108]